MARVLDKRVRANFTQIDFSIYDLMGFHTDSFVFFFFTETTHRGTDSIDLSSQATKDQSRTRETATVSSRATSTVPSRTTVMRPTGMAYLVAESGHNNLLGF